MRLAGTPATLNVLGQPSTPYTITGDATVTLSDSSNDPTMNAVLTYPSNPRTLSGAGTDSWNVTGVLTVAALQPANTYTGTYNVTVNY